MSYTVTAFIDPQWKQFPTKDKPEFSMVLDSKELASVMASLMMNELVNALALFADDDVELDIKTDQVDDENLVVSVLADDVAIASITIRPSTAEEEAAATQEASLSEYFDKPIHAAPAMVQ